MRVWLRTAFYLIMMFIIAFTASFGRPAAATERPRPVTTVTGGAGSITPVAGWDIQSSAKAQESGWLVSRARYPTKGWYPVSARSTIFAGLLENGKARLTVYGMLPENGKHQHIFTGTNLRELFEVNRNRSPFAIPWWYRTRFRLRGNDLHTFIKIKGIIPRADIWLNGTKIADHNKIVGAFTVHTLNVTRLVHAGVNILAIRVYPANAERDFIPGWIDWNPSPPDHDMGIWRDVDILRSGAVSLHGARVTSKLSLPKLKRADLTIKVNVRNDGDAPLDARVSGHVAGVALSQTVHLLPDETRTVIFDPNTSRGLRLRHPRVWWPAGMGVHPLYHLSLSADVGGAVSDRASTTFGIRDVRSHLTKQGYRQFVINGMPLLIRGAAWTPDMFLRDWPKRLAEEFRYVRNLGLNAMRTEGKLDRQDFYDLADRNGIMILPGWECCDKWEAWAGTGGEPWDAADRKIARRSMASEARLLRNHPSVIAFLIGSDGAPPPPIAKIYANALHRADWPDPIISAASGQKTAPTGPSGMKMLGPYVWVPPNYWYADKRGGAFGFASETGPGVDIPRLDTLKKMMTSSALESLWTDPNAKPFHAEPIGFFPRLKVFYAALVHRYGKPRNLADYVEKAELDNYTTARAEFEAYSARMDANNPATGVIYWMLNNAWPSLHGHLFDYYLDPAGAYFGAKKANEPVHIQYSYDDRSIMAVDHTRRPAQDLNAHIRIYNLDGSVRYNKQLAHVNVPANHAVKLLTVPKPQGLSTTYFLELTLSEPKGQTVSRNVYWLSTRPNKLNWNQSTGYYTPVTRYADLTGLNRLPNTAVHISASTRRHGDAEITTIKLTNTSKSATVALFQHLSLRRGRGGSAVLPITWSGNDITLWPGESATLSAHYDAAALKGATPAVRLQGVNVARRTVVAPVKQ